MGIDPDRLFQVGVEPVPLPGGQPRRVGEGDGDLQKLPQAFLQDLIEDHLVLLRGIGAGGVDQHPPWDQGFQGPAEEHPLEAGQAGDDPGILGQRGAVPSIGPLGGAGGVQEDPVNPHLRREALPLIHTREDAGRPQTVSVRP